MQLQMEKLTPPTDGHNTTGDINPAIHGFDGSSAFLLTKWSSDDVANNRAH